jgi:hypothetical protein
MSGSSMATRFDPDGADGILPVQVAQRHELKPKYEQSRVYKTVIDSPHGMSVIGRIIYA